MLNDKRELWWAAAAIALITLMYAGFTAATREIPPASGLFGHLIGVFGFILMLSTETLYSIRKRSRSARWGKMSTWLRIHIFTGLVGPYMVLLHSSWKFHGLAGAVTLLTVIIVISGFIGRYIYTSVPRTAEGIVVEASEASRQIAAVEAQLQELMLDKTVPTAALSPVLAGSSSKAAVANGEIDRRQFRHWLRQQRKSGSDAAREARCLELLLRQHKTLQRQMASLAAARRTLAVWHAVHIPIGMALFTAAFIHTAAALYYATLLR